MDQAYIGINSTTIGGVSALPATLLGGTAYTSPQTFILTDISVMIGYGSAGATCIAEVWSYDTATGKPAAKIAESTSDVVTVAVGAIAMQKFSLTAGLDLINGTKYYFIFNNTSIGKSLSLGYTANAAAETYGSLDGGVTWINSGAVDVNSYGPVTTAGPSDDNVGFMTFRNMRKQQRYWAMRLMGETY